jgi:hypothetical protein
MPVSRLLVVALAASALACAGVRPSQAADGPIGPAAASASETTPAPDAPAAQPGTPADPLLKRADDFAALFRPDPTLPPDTFDAPLARLIPNVAPTLSRIHAQYGPVVEVRLVERKTPTAGKFLLRFEKGATVNAVMAIAEEVPHLVTTLWFDSPRPELASFQEAIEKLQALPGQVSFAVCQLHEDRVETLAALNPDLPLAIGSTFKLYVLGALIDEVRQGRRRWDEVITLEERFQSLPSGMLQSWPVGAPVTLHTLASLMISRSDNTATDHLLFLIGRERVEAMLEAMGNRHLDRNRPFLSTAEMFRLKGIDGGSAGRQFLARGTAERRAFLDTEVPKLSLKKVSFEAPRMISEIEWFASASDLCRAMDALRRATEDDPGAAGRGVLGINAARVDEGQFAWAGYKGGSEPGVLNLTWLARGHDGIWWAVSAGWNDPQAAVDEEKLAAIGAGVLKLIAAPAVE